MKTQELIAENEKLRDRLALALSLLAESQAAMAKARQMLIANAGDAAGTTSLETGEGDSRPYGTAAMNARAFNC